MVGKRIHVWNFLGSAHEKARCCDYLLSTDLEMSTPNSHAASSWQRGYGDYVMKPDLSTLRTMPWLEGIMMVLCDSFNQHTNVPVLYARGRF